LKYKVSVIIPTIEEVTIFKVIGEIRELLGSGTEIIVVDKSSSAYHERLKKAGVRAIRQKDRGVARAIMLGMRSAEGDILASIDADGTHDVGGLPEAVRMVESGRVDFVLGNRLNLLQKGSMGPYLRFGNLALSAIFDVTYGARVHDVLTGLFVMKKETFGKMESVEPYSTGTAFFAAEAAKRGDRIGEVDIKYYPREHGESKLAGGSGKFIWGLRAAVEFLEHMR
jgi:glycosyltransferase involved in cell wall biosynthesis